MEGSDPMADLDRTSAFPTATGAAERVPRSCARSMGGCASASPSRQPWRTSSGEIGRPHRSAGGESIPLPGPVPRAARGRALPAPRGSTRLAPGTATVLFIAYAALTGVTFSVILLAYTGASIANTFMVTAGMFGALAVFGTTTSEAWPGRPVPLHGADRAGPGHGGRDVLGRTRRCSS